MARRDIRGSRAVITGASSGIGRALAVEMARQGASLVITARREDRLNELATRLAESGSRVESVAGDITDADLRARVIETARSRLGGLDVLVNNAGVGAMGLFEKAGPERLRRLMEVNFFAPVEMVRLALPLLKQAQRPIVVNISSILGHRGVPYHTEYCAGKFALQGFSQALRAELARHPIDVLVVSPGTTETEFFTSVIDRTGEPTWPKHGAVTAERVARAIVHAIRRGRHEIIPFGWGRVLVWLNRLAPTWMDRVMEKYL